MSITDNTRLIIKVCQLYYEENLSQKEISTQLRISRPQISRILAYARSNNIVSIKINNPFSKETELERALVERFGLKDALVVNTNGVPGNQALVELGIQAGSQMETYISDNNLVGLMSGKTISELVKAVGKFERRGVEFVPLIGGIGSGGADWHANFIAQNFAERVGGKYYILNAPVIVQSKEAKEMLINEPNIKEVLQKAEKCDVAILGIGQVSVESTNVKAGALSAKDIEQLKKAGAVASVCASYLDANGRIIENDITDRSIGVTLNGLKKCKRKIAVAIGSSKVEAIKAVLFGRHIDVLITNIETATQILA